MKPYFFLLFLFTIRCSPAQKHKSFIPVEYHYPFNKIGKGKTKVYQNTESAGQLFSNVKTKKISGKSYLFTTQYVSGSKIDSSVFVNDNLVDNYTFADGKIIKNEVEEDVIIGNGRKLGQHKVNIIYNTASSIVSSEIEEEYLKDTSLYWQGTPADCLVIKATVSQVSPGNNNFLSGQKHKTNLTSYYAKGLGLIRFQRNDGFNVSMWYLKEIRDIIN